MSVGDVDTLMELWAATQAEKGQAVDPPFANARDLRDSIDAISKGETAWQAFTVKYDGDKTDGAPGWMSKEYEVWFRDPLTVLEGQIGNPDFVGKIDYAPKEVYGKNHRRQFTDLMSGEWAWEQAVSLFGYIPLLYLSCTSPGYHFSRLSQLRWGHVCSSGPGKRQDDRLCCHRAQRILSSLYLTWKCSKSRPPGA